MIHVLCGSMCFFKGIFFRFQGLSDGWALWSIPFWPVLRCFKGNRSLAEVAELSHSCCTRRREIAWRRTCESSWSRGRGETAVLGWGGEFCAKLRGECEGITSKAAVKILNRCTVYGVKHEHLVLVVFCLCWCSDCESSCIFQLGDQERTAS